jgi:hypothetical protein
VRVCTVHVSHLCLLIIRSWRCRNSFLDGLATSGDPLLNSIRVLPPFIRHPVLEANPFLLFPHARSRSAILDLRTFKQDGSEAKSIFRRVVPSLTQNVFPAVNTSNASKESSQESLLLWMPRYCVNSKVNETSKSHSFWEFFVATRIPHDDCDSHSRRQHKRLCQNSFFQFRGDVLLRQPSLLLRRPSQAAVILKCLSIYQGFHVQEFGSVMVDLRIAAIILER